MNLAGVMKIAVGCVPVFTIPCPSLLSYPHILRHNLTSPFSFQEGDERMVSGNDRTNEGAEATGGLLQRERDV